MKGNPKVIEVLNKVLKKELTGINQYFIHYKMQQDWGYNTLAKKSYDESIDEMKHADRVIDRILFLEGVPNMSDYDPIRVGINVRAQITNDKLLEEGAIENLRAGIIVCNEAKDHATRKMLEELIAEEEDHLDWLETQEHLIEEMGYELYLSKQV